MSLFRLMPVLLLTPVMIYFYFFIRRMVRFWFHPQWKRWHSALIAAVCVGLGYFSSSLFTSGIVVVMHLFMLCLGTDVLNLFLRKIKQLRWWTGVYRSGMLPIATTLAVLVFAYWNIHHVVKTDYIVETDKSIRAEGYQVVFISDLHAGLTLDSEDLQQYAREIAELQPDLVILGGDIVDEGTSLECMQLSFQILGDIPSELGTFYVYGNHDRSNHWGECDYTTAQLDAAMAEAGIQVLSDEVLQLTEDLVLVGREDASFGGDRERLSAEQLMKGVSKEDFILLLDHQPLELGNNRELGVDLQLSGHTHNGQIWPVGLVSESFEINEMTYGIQQMEDYHIIVSSGMAGWGYPFRTSGSSEYVMVDIQGK